MRSLTLEINRSGAVLTVHVCVSASRRKAMLRARVDPPQPVSIDLLIDTGATTTMIDEGVMRALALPASGITDYDSASTNGISDKCALYDIELIIGGQATDKTWRINPLQVMGNSFINQPFDGLLGRDVLDRAQLEYNGMTRRCTLIYV